MHEEAREELRVRLKLVLLELAHHFGVTKACREFNLPHSTFYRRKQKYDEGQFGLYGERPVAYRHPRRTSPEVVDKILAIRAEYQLGALRIMYYLDHYHGIKISESTVTRVLRAHGIRRRALHTKRDAKTVSRTPGAGRCEVPATERSRGKGSEAVPIYSNYDRPHISLDGKTPDEVMKSLLQ